MSQLLELIKGLGAPFNMVATVFLIFGLIAVVAAVAGLAGVIVKEIRAYASHREELQFKRDMIERGMTLDEVDRLIQMRRDESKVQV